MKQYVLVPLDGSALSEAILPHAVAVAQATKSALLLLQVLEPVFEPIYGGLGIPEYVEEEQLTQMRDEQLAAIHHYLENIANQLRSDGLEIYTKVIEGNHPATQIMWEAEHDPLLSMIAMTTHGRGAYYTGSLEVSQQKLSRSPQGRCSCFVLKRATGYSPWRISKRFHTRTSSFHLMLQHLPSKH